MFNLSNLNPRIQTESTFSFNDSYNESRKYSLSSSEFDSLSQLSEVDLNNIKYVQIGQKNVRKNLNNVSDFATFRVNKTISNNNIVLNGVSKIQRVAKNYWTGFKGGEYDIEMQLIYTPILAASTINRQYRLDKSNSKLIIKELRPNIAERGSSPRLRNSVYLPYLSFITTNNVNGNHNNTSSGSTFTTSPTPTTPSQPTSPSNPTTPTTNNVWITENFNTTITIRDHYENTSLVSDISNREKYDNSTRFLWDYKRVPNTGGNVYFNVDENIFNHPMFKEDSIITKDKIKSLKFLQYYFINKNDDLKVISRKIKITENESKIIVESLGGNKDWSDNVKWRDYVIPSEIFVPDVYLEFTKNILFNSWELDKSKSYIKFRTPKQNFNFYGSDKAHIDKLKKEDTYTPYFGFITDKDINNSYERRRTTQPYSHPKLSPEDEVIADELDDLLNGF